MEKEIFFLTQTSNEKQCRWWPHFCTFFWGGGFNRASLVTLGSRAFPLHSLLGYSDTNPHIMYPKRGDNTPAKSEHHRKRTSGSPERIKEVRSVWVEGGKKRSQKTKETFLPDTFRGIVQCWNLTFTRVLRASCAPKECVRKLDSSPASVEILWAWSVCVEVFSR